MNDSEYLISTVETYRVNSEEGAAALIEDAKENDGYTLIKYTSEHKEKVLKGEIVDEFWKVTLTKSFNDIKDPERHIGIEYGV